MTKIPDVFKAQAANHKPSGSNSPWFCFGHWVLEFAACALRTVEIYLELAQSFTSCGAWDLEF
ncbi:MAG: hypothetical protein JRJ47_06540 [Deltaproteobacteria bacterium]|nr:hypothetical protein [Deltaproteobacteria bacterium]